MHLLSMIRIIPFTSTSLNSMLAHRLRKAQIELHAHRCWLSAFVQQTRGYHRLRRSISSPLILCNRDQRSHLLRNGIQNAVPATNAFASKQAKAKKNILHLRLDIQGQREGDALDKALANAQWKPIAHAYRSFSDKKQLTRRHVNAITNRLHQALRESKWDQKLDIDLRNHTGSEIVEFAEELVEDIKKGKLVPSKRAHLRLLGIFKESGWRDGGVTFWQWLEKQDDAFVDADVYGAATELLAVNGTPLSELEELYQQALRRFPGSFASYHLSPEAVLEDRNKPTALQGLHMTLLQGITTARLLNGDTRNAYLALDTAFRLYPDQVPSRFLTLFSEERPVVEAYTVFAMAWRAGISIPLGHVKYQLSALRSNSDGITAKRHPFALRAMLSVMYMHAGARGAITQNSVNELVIAMTQLLRMDAISTLEAKDKQKLVREVMELIRKCIAVFVRFGARPGLSAFNSIIVNLGGYGHSKQTIGVALADARSLGIEPNEVTRRSVIIAAGLLDDADLMQKAWAEIVEARLLAEEAPDTIDFHCLTKAAHLTGQIDFARDEFAKYEDSFGEHDRDMITNCLDDGNMYNLGVEESKEQFKTSALLKDIERISADLDVIDQNTRNPGMFHDYSEQELPMKLLVEDEVSLPESDMQRIYDDLTTVPRAAQSTTSDAEELSAESSDEPDSSASSPPAVTPTNIPFGTIRYENWKLMNWLLEQSEMNDKAYLEAVDKAIAAGIAPPARSKGLGPTLAGRDIQSFGLSDLVDSNRKAKKERPAKEEEVMMAKEHILRLRGRTS